MRTYQTVPSTSRTRVTRRPTCLDGADRLAEVDGVADAVLVLDHHHHAGQEVLDQVLGAEADRQAEHAGAGEDRGDVHPDLGEHHHERDAEDHGRGDALQQRAEALGPLGAAGVGRACRRQRAPPRRVVRPGRWPWRPASGRPPRRRRSPGSRAACRSARWRRWPGSRCRSSRRRPRRSSCRSPGTGGHARAGRRVRDGRQRKACEGGYEGRGERRPSRASAILRCVFTHDSGRHARRPPRPIALLRRAAWPRAGRARSAPAVRRHARGLGARRPTSRPWASCWSS